MRKPLLYRAAAVVAGALLALTGASTAFAGGNGGNHGNGGGYNQGGSNTGGSNTEKCTTGDFDQVPQFTFDNGTATANFSLSEGAKCAPTDVTLVSYLAPRPQFDVPQFLFAHHTVTVSPDQRSASLTVDVPDCNTQVDLFVGGEQDIIEKLVEGGKRYGDTKLQYWNGGASNCVQPAVQYVSNCDGSIDLSLSNNGKLSGYPVTFEISYGGQKQSVTVANGQATTEPIHIPAGGGTITVSADKLKPVTIDWTRPEACGPTATAKNDCTTVTVTVTNPEKNVPAKADVTYGDSTKSVTVAPGTAEDVTFTAGEATTATVAFPGLTGVKPLTVDVVKAECTSASPSTPSSESPSASPSPSGSTTPTAGTTTTPATAPSTTPVSNDSNLPTTGAAAGTIAGGAALLLIIGGVLFFLARRRKVNFTA